MKRLITIIILSVLIAIAGITSCTHKTKVLPAPFSDGNYPADVAQIIINKCTYSGCHNAASYKFAAGLRLDTWQHMFEGSQTGAEVVAFSAQFSPLLYYCNAHDAADVSATYPGHLDTPLTLAEYNVLKSWIAAGAPDKNGNVPFPTPVPDNRPAARPPVQPPPQPPPRQAAPPPPARPTQPEARPAPKPAPPPQRDNRTDKEKKDEKKPPPPQ